MSDRPPLRDSQLDDLLAEWAAARRLDDGEIAAIRASVFATAADPERSLDADWLWHLLRPVTALLEPTSNPVGIGLPTRVFRRWPSLSDPSAYRPYLQLA